MTDDACLSVENAKLLERVEEWFRAERKQGTTYEAGGRAALDMWRQK